MASRDDDIKGMSPEEKAANVEEAQRKGTPTGEPQAEPGTREAPVKPQTAEDVAQAANVADQDHTHAQGEAGNIQRGHIKWNGLDITIETPAGGVRKGLNPETGEPWETTHTVPYGYIRGTEGADGMHVDAYMGDHPTAPTVYVVDEKDRDTGAWRQHKAFLGFQTPKAAIDAYLGTSSKRPENLGGMRAMSVPEFKEWLKTGAKEPASEAMGAGPYYNVLARTWTSAQPPPIITEPSKTPSAPRASIPARCGRPTSRAPPRSWRKRGFPPKTPFPVAVARSLIEDGHISPETATEVLGNESAQALLQPTPSERGQASHLLRHQAPALVGRIPRYRLGSLAAALRMHRPKPPQLSGLAKPPKLGLKPPQPVVPKVAQVPFSAPPAGSALPKTAAAKPRRPSRRSQRH